MNTRRNFIKILSFAPLGLLATLTPSSQNPPKDRNNLTTYQRVIVVDAGGAGDFTTLSAALASISGAAVNARFCILLFGYIAESADCVCPDFVDIIGMPGHQLAFASGKAFKPSGTFTNTLNIPVYDSLFFYGANGRIVFADNARANFRNCKIAGSIYSAIGCVGNFRDCEISNFQSNLINGTFNFHGGSIFGAADLQLGGDVIVYLHGVTVETVSLTPLILQDNARCEVYGGSINAISSYPGVVAAQVLGGSLKLIGTHVEASEAVDGIGLYFESGVSLLAGACVFKGGGTGLAVVANEMVTDVQIYQSLFLGGVTNISCASGTPNGSNV